MHDLMALAPDHEKIRASETYGPGIGRTRIARQSGLVVDAEDNQVHCDRT